MRVPMLIVMFKDCAVYPYRREGFEIFAFLLRLTDVAIVACVILGWWIVALGIAAFRFLFIPAVIWVWAQVIINMLVLFGRKKTR